MDINNEELFHILKPISWHPYTGGSGYVNLNEYSKDTVFKSIDSDGDVCIEIYPSNGGWVKFKLKDCVSYDEAPFHG